MWVEVGRWKTELMTPFRASLNATFDAIRTTQHATREVHLTGCKQLPDLARTHTTAAQFNFRHFAGDEAELASHPFEQLDVAFAIMAESEALAEIDFLRV
jgi:hypothetical protein